MDLIEVVYRIDGLETLSPGWCRHGEAIHLVTETLERNVRGEGGGGTRDNTAQVSPGQQSIPLTLTSPGLSDSLETR